MKASSILIVVCLLIGWLPSVSAESQLTGEIEGAFYQIDLPRESNGKLLLLAHGYRPESLPKTADYGAGNSLPETLLGDGWTLASTSYRRNGWIMEDAGKDMVNLLDFISAEIFDPTEVYLMGNSMGGGVITWLAENHPNKFDGGVGLGAYLFNPIGEAEEIPETVGAHYNSNPQVPLLYLTNTSELEGPELYIESAKDAEIVPVLWTIDRAGHVNQNESEQLVAFYALVEWATTGDIVSEHDATIVLNPESTVTISNKKIEAKAQTLVEVYGNFISNVVRDDMAAVGLVEGDTFALIANGQTVPVLLGSTYNDVSVGEWVAFWDAEGYLLFCRNYKHAVNSLGLKPSNPIILSAE